MADPRIKVIPFPGDRRQGSSYVLLRLYRQMYGYSRARGIRYWLAAMERPLARSLAIRNFAFAPIGPESDYFGQVAPYMADLHDLERRLHAHNPRLLEWLRLPVDSTERLPLRGGDLELPLQGESWHATGEGSRAA